MFKKFRQMQNDIVKLIKEWGNIRERLDKLEKDRQPQNPTVYQNSKWENN